MKKRLAVIGTGSAGILSLSYFLTYLHNEWEIVSVYDPDIPILGIGESSNAGFIEVLEQSFGFTFLNDLEPLSATKKFGTKWQNWREKDFVSTLFGGNCAIHFDTSKLKDYVIPKLKTRWPEKFKIIEGRVESLENRDKDVSVVINGQEHYFNYVIDCRGFPKSLETDYKVFDNIPVNRCLVHNKPEPGDWEYTGHVAHKNGWMWEIPLTFRKSYGYLFNDKITSVEDAKQDFSQLINVPVDQLQNIEYKFTSYYSTKVMDGRIIKNGNLAGFYEPISATSIFMYDQLNRLFLNYLSFKIESVDDLNAEYAGVAEAVRELICYFYHGGSTYDTEFWDYAKTETSKVVADSKIIKKVKMSFDKYLEGDVPALADTWFFSPSQLYYLDKQFGYNYFSR